MNILRSKRDDTQAGQSRCRYCRYWVLLILINLRGRVRGENLELRSQP